MYATRLFQPFRSINSNALRVTFSKNAPAVSLLRKNARSTASTANTTPEHEKLLVSQRAVRPLSPWYIYQPQLTWLLSLTHRATGAGLASVLYGASLAYVAGPFIGLNWDTDTIVAAASTVPAFVKVPTKFGIAYVFSFHVFNGIRHLIWDTGRSLTIKGVYATGWSVLGLSTVSALYLSLV
ncbi:12087_t:CDS:2 [Ambispora leptoticha]|uniref:12087_t:CDS:1 n=1 Tax=Ambispora leptoticha TaxID=144679 RepID=A0A9N8YQM4_9GLOM|nr:12087_t:CDS:2 [Ambispora leptoticha]